MQRIAVIDYGMGNLHSVSKAIEHVAPDDEVIVTDDEALMPLNLREVRHQAERKALNRALARTDGNISKAAELLGITRPTFYDLMQRHQITDKKTATIEETS